MKQYKVLKDIIKGAKPNETVNLTDDEARAYGPSYVELIDQVDTKAIEAPKVNKAITTAKNKGL